MKNVLLRPILCALALSGMWIAGPVVAEHEHHHGHESAPSALTLDQGKKWGTDDALRKGMGAIRELMNGKLHAIHKDTLSAEDFAQLATAIDQQVAEIVRQCKLTPAADANLHLIIAQLAKGTQAMRQPDQAKSGATQVVDALQSYRTYFDDAAFKAITE